MVEFRVIDLLTTTVDPEPRIVTARNAEHAAQVALGLDLTRSGTRENLRARVYYEHPGHPVTMVRLYTRVK